MKGKKCIGLLILCITCLLSLNLFSNANALVKSTITWRYIGGFKYKYGYNNTSYTSYSINTYNNGLVRNLSLSASGSNVSTITDIELVAQNNAPFVLSKERFYHHQIYFFSKIEQPEFTFITALCPRARNTIIDKCEVKELSRENYIQNITQYPDPNNVGNFVAGIGGNANNIQMIEIWGHGTTDEVNNLTSLTYYGSWLYLLQNTDNILPAPVDLTIYFSPIEIYTEQESPTDDAAEKELQDRDNLETQSTNTDNQANTATQSAENTGSTLFAAFTQFFNALTNVSGSSCVLPTMQVYSLDLGQMDLCTFDIPPQIMALVSIGMVFIIVPLGIHLVKKMINLYKEITG